MSVLGYTATIWGSLNALFLTLMLSGSRYRVDRRRQIRHEEDGARPGFLIRGG
jgi:hypothetical protein